MDLHCPPPKKKVLVNVSCILFLGVFSTLSPPQIGESKDQTSPRIWTLDCDPVGWWFSLRTLWWPALLFFRGFCRPCDIFLAILRTWPCWGGENVTQRTGNPRPPNKESKCHFEWVVKQFSLMKVAPSWIGCLIQWDHTTQFYRDELPIPSMYG